MSPRRSLLTIALLLGYTLTAAAQTVPATGAAASAPQRVDPALAEVNDLRARLIDAFNKADIDALLACTDPDVIVTWQDAEVTHGRDELRRYYERMMKGPDSVVESIHADPVVEGRIFSGDNVISFGHMNDTFKLRNGMDFRLDSRFSALLSRNNGKLLVRGFHLSGNIFQNEIQSAMIRKTGIYVGAAAGAVGLILGVVIGRLMRRKPVTRAVA